MIGLISTIKERCRVCYTCVRDCPAKAIRISGGQAEVIAERCIGCGNCVRVCRQNAKKVAASTEDVQRLLNGSVPVAAIVAPSFPVEYQDLDYNAFVGMVRRLGFDYVSEVSFGADLVANAYRKLIANGNEQRYIATSCPAIVAYVEKYHPGLVPYLAPVISPMVAMARVMHHLYGDNLKIVFIGPCFAKKSEANRDLFSDEIDEVLTFSELNSLFERHSITAQSVEASEFDPPPPGLGALFPISRGMLQASHLQEDLLSEQVLAVDGKSNFVQAIKEFENGALTAQLLEVLCCNGCIMGPGISKEKPYFTRRNAVSHYARKRIEALSQEDRRLYHDRLQTLDLSVTFRTEDCRIPLPSKEDIDKVLAAMGKHNPEDELDCGACGYETCREHAIAIHKGLAENEMCLPFTIERLKQSLSDLHQSNEELAHTQQALIAAEKRASMGQLSAGIAHEINNPLGVILLYAKLMAEACPKDSEMYEEINMIVEQAERCKTIVSGLLNFARKNKVVHQATDICNLIDRCLKAIIKPEHVQIDVEHRLIDRKVEVDADQIMQVLTNLIMNAVEAMPEGGRIAIKTEQDNGRIKIHVQDTGPGIPESIQQKIFEPLFTTKQIGKGTGLGLAVTYGIIKMHRGQIEVISNCDQKKGPTGTTFVVTLPRQRNFAANGNGQHEQSNR